MQFEPLQLEGAYLITPPLVKDDRGYFSVTYQKEPFAELGLVTDWVQDNQSYSHKDVIRGFHFQLPPHTETKLVRVIHGAILDVIVDLRKASPTFGQSISVHLSDKNRQLLYIPRGFGHGFLALEPHTVLLYKVDNGYAPNANGGLIWNDPTIGFDWGITNPILSEKDQALPTLAEFESPF
jgi:dTDP-4-dehydrorhamnose 3,5-epimerase